MRRYLAEAIGTFGFAFVACGAVVFGGDAVGTTEIALAVGLVAAAMTVAAGAAHGPHLNPIVSLASWAAGRTRTRELAPMCFAQLAGGVTGAAAATFAAMGRPGASIEIAQSVTAGYGRGSPAGFGMVTALLVMAALGALLAFVALGTAALAPPARALAAGFAYAAAAFVGLPVANAVGNPALVVGPALLLGGDALAQLWVFVAAPAAGALVIGALTGAGALSATMAVDQTSATVDV
jgi:aquaporin Z